MQQTAAAACNRQLMGLVSMCGASMLQDIAVTGYVYVGCGGGGGAGVQPGLGLATPVMLLWESCVTPQRPHVLELARSID